MDVSERAVSGMISFAGGRLRKPIESLMFDKRRGWTDDQIRNRVYGVMLADIFEWTYFSHNEHLIDDKQREDWTTIWKR